MPTSETTHNTSRTLVVIPNYNGLRFLPDCMEALSRQLDFPYRRCGALVLCFDEADVPRLEELKARGERNGVEGLAVLDREALRRQEPGSRRRLWPRCMRLPAPLSAPLA